MTVRLIINKGVAYLPFNHPVSFANVKHTHTHTYTHILIGRYELQLIFEPYRKKLIYLDDTVKYLHNIAIPDALKL